MCPKEFHDKNIFAEEVVGLTGKVNLDHQGDRNLNFQVLDMTENGTFESILTIRYQNKIMEAQFEVSTAPFSQFSLSNTAGLSVSKLSEIFISIHTVFDAP